MWVGGVFELGNPEWRGAQAVLEIQADGGGGQKTVPSVVGVWIFSGITPYMTDAGESMQLPHFI